ncbi:LacI family DNA-binding transcriptional regulator [Leucobacter denitrificans]|uniref:LacI family DNA-binding transcriptional regulator n=1 Tax=Leucobacter denitrificans TaxID=683042 RepID=UPI001FEB6482|nr:LacI family DNA-binding transcriptional regulator [Leucobacter denitrificans]
MLSGSSAVTEATRNRVEEAAKSLNYRPSDLTRAVFAGRSNSIGVLFADMRSPYYVGLIEGITHVSSRAGALAYLAAGNRDMDQEEQILSLMDSHRVRGLITAAHHHDDLILNMAESGTECVYITREPTFIHPRAHSIRLDNIAAGNLALQHLTEIGCTRTLIVNQTPLRLTSIERTQGFRDAAQAAGLHIADEQVHKLDSLSAPSADLAQTIQTYWQQGRIDSVFATTGAATFRAYEALAGSGLRIPEDIAILGIDDFQWASHLAAPLSVITQPTFDMGEAAAKLILEEPGSSQTMIFPPSIIVRESTLGHAASDNDAS